MKKEKNNKNNIVYKANDICSLADLKVKQKGRVTKIECASKALRRRLLDMGITKGVIVKIEMISPLSDPFNISLRGYELCIRKSDLENIECEVVE